MPRNTSPLRKTIARNLHSADPVSDILRRTGLVRTGDLAGQLVKMSKHDKNTHIISGIRIEDGVSGQTLRGYPEKSLRERFFGMFRPQAAIFMPSKSGFEN